jgi:hypothetical protein
MTPEELYYRSAKIAPAHEGAETLAHGLLVFGVLALFLLLSYVWGKLSRD